MTNCGCWLKDGLLDLILLLTFSSTVRSNCDETDGALSQKQCLHHEIVVPMTGLLDDDIMGLKDLCCNHEARLIYVYIQGYILFDVG